MSFADDLSRFRAKVQRKSPDVVAATAVLALESIRYGSSRTGAPGQPVDTSNLLNSWGLEMESPTRALISTPVEYAPAVEDGVGPHGPVLYGAKNNVGGSHSVKLTLAAGQRLVDEAVRQVGDD